MREGRLSERAGERSLTDCGRLTVTHNHSQSHCPQLQRCCVRSLFVGASLSLSLSLCRGGAALQRCSVAALTTYVVSNRTIVAFAKLVKCGCTASRRCVVASLRRLLRCVVCYVVLLSCVALRCVELCSVLFCSVLFCSVLFCSVLFCSVLLRCVALRCVLLCSVVAVFCCVLLC